METFQFYYGIDVAKDSLQISYQTNQGQWQDTSIANSVPAISDWLLTLSLSTSHFTFEYSGTYSYHLAYALSLQAASFSIITAKQSKGFRESLKKISKTDKQDARCLSLYGKQMQPALSILPDEKLHQKQQQYKHLAVLRQDKRSFMNRLHALNYDTKADKIVLKSTKDMIDFLELQIQILQDELFTIDDQEAHRILQLMTSVVGIGPQSAQAVLIATNAFKDFDNDKQVAKFFGVCPSNHQSGSSVYAKGSITKSGAPYVRSLLYVAAHSAIRFNKVCKDLFTRLRAKGKPYKVAMLAVVHKLVTQLFFVVKNKVFFDNNFVYAK